jgi:hypothetical protein
MPIYRRGGDGGDSGLPEISEGDALKVVRVKSDESGMELAAVPVELPVIAEGDAGKVLTVKEDESGMELVTPSTGGADEAAVLAIALATGY